MKGLVVKENKRFIGREREKKLLLDLQTRGEAALVIVYGRRRIGKTELIEQFYRKKAIFKFEGIEIGSEDKRNPDELRGFQIQRCLERLSHYLDDPILMRIHCDTWSQFFELLNEAVSSKEIVLYFEEVQWLANYESRFFAELKPFWDDQWRHNPLLTLVICGSSPSFIVTQLLSDKALYARATVEIHLEELSIHEISKFLGNKGAKETMLATLCVGGVCEYLKRLQEGPNVISDLCKHSFVHSSFFLLEHERIFVSSLSKTKYYRRILQILAQHRYCTYIEIANRLNDNQQGGGSLSRVLNDLELCGFITKLTPLHKGENSKLVRYHLADQYVQFYYRFIAPKKSKIQSGRYANSPTSALDRHSLEIGLGFSFERWCRKNEKLFARILGISGIDYEAGSYFDRATDKEEPGFQIDLMYIVKGSTIIICEIKYYDGLVGNEVVGKVKRKIELFRKTRLEYRNYTFKAVLITTEGVKNEAQILSTFDRVISLKEIFATVAH